MRSTQLKQSDASASAVPLAPRPAFTEEKEESRDESPTGRGFQVSFLFVGKDDAPNKTLSDKRRHVMREFRRQQRWKREEETRKSKQREGSDGKAQLRNRLLASRTTETTRPLPRSSGAGLSASLESRANEMAYPKEEQDDDVPVGSFASDVPILDCFTDRFVDSFAPVCRADCGSSDAIRTAASVRVFSPLLRTAFDAVSTAFVGRQTGDADVVYAGQSAYARVLRRLQSALSHSVYSKSGPVLATVVLLIAYESMKHTSSDALRMQSAGVLQLIEFRGPYRHIHGLEHLCFSELRPYWVYASLVLRKPSFLSKPEWKFIPWVSAEIVKDIMQHLLDHVVDIPALLYEFDMLQGSTSERKSASDQATPKQHALWLFISEVESRLRRWKLEWADTYPEGQLSEEEAPSKGQTFPVFRCRDPSTDKIITPPILIYPDPQLCRCLCTFWAAMLVLSSIDTRPSGAIEPLETFEWACCICRSIQYFVQNVPGNMTNRMAFPLAAAHGALSTEGVERSFIDEVYRVVEQRKVSKVFITIKSETE